MYIYYTISIYFTYKFIYLYILFLTKPIFKIIITKPQMKFQEKVIVRSERVTLIDRSAECLLKTQNQWKSQWQFVRGSATASTVSISQMGQSPALS